MIIDLPPSAAQPCPSPSIARDVFCFGEIARHAEAARAARDYP